MNAVENLRENGASVEGLAIYAARPARIGHSAATARWPFMADVKGGRTHPLREERAVGTRDRITDAVRRLGRSGGYGATTLTDAARETGVAVQAI